MKPIRHFCIFCALLSISSCWAGQATLMVSSQPTGARVFVKGAYRGVTPLTLTFRKVTATPQSYSLLLVKDGYQRWTGRVSLVAGSRKNVPVRLSRGKVATGRLSGKVICIDPGHPSETSSGTKGKQVSEIKINWQVAQRLKALLETRGAKVVLTKPAEKAYVTNRRRAEIANAAGANLMIRLHCDAASARGLGVYYPDRQGAKAGVTGPSQKVIDNSAAAAKALYPAVITALQGKVPGRGIHGDSGTAVGAKQGALTGSIFARVPVLTVEMVVLTNPTDENFIISPEGQAAMAGALALGVVAAVNR